MLCKNGWNGKELTVRGCKSRKLKKRLGAGRRRCKILCLPGPLAELADMDVRAAAQVEVSMGSGQQRQAGQRTRQSKHA